MRRKEALTVLVLLVIACSTAVTSKAATREVCPGGCAYASIQTAINEAANDDEVLVYDGTYYERIDFLGKAIAVKSKNGAATTIIDGSQAGSVVTFHSGEGRATLLQGFTIRNGLAESGAGINCEGSSPTVTNCDISDNTSPWGGESGGGIYCGGGASSSPKFMN